MRLIDVNEITDGEIVKYLGKEYGFCVPDVRDLLKDQPTAFDVEKVVKQLEEESEQSYVDFESYAKEHNIGSGFNDWHYKGLNRAIEIVKRGGRDEE